MEKNLTASGLTLNFDTIYDDYETFMNESRDPIYRTILKAFEKLKDREKVSVNVFANVEMTEFESELEFTKSNLDILTDVINPYFEEREEYELCAKVMKILSELKN
ncbi:MAG TPA: hypothetical protein VMX17_09260 [Candidatus Glassbacteria bacterium]|nr:hypothetical protein [Candidatus Glassbacteria bacterium]